MKMKENWFEDKRKRKYGVAFGIRFSWDPDLEMYERFVVCSSGCNLKTALDSEMLSDIFYEVMANQYLQGWYKPLYDSRENFVNLIQRFKNSSTYNNHKEVIDEALEGIATEEIIPIDGYVLKKLLPDHISVRQIGPFDYKDLPERKYRFKLVLDDISIKRYLQELEDDKVYGNDLKYEQYRWHEVVFSTKVTEEHVLDVDYIAAYGGIYRQLYNALDEGKLKKWYANIMADFYLDCWNNSCNTKGEICVNFIKNLKESPAYDDYKEDIDKALEKIENEEQNPMAADVFEEILLNYTTLTYRGIILERDERFECIDHFELSCFE